ncbi:putative ribonuclease H protein At1g65750 family [Senna tora]|uniref:Putative ribonuclease H protein At1g65750 family n=1 Tax=Senna tora TaxID=362788 RepID=A0A834SWF2_9FABA|nr:putative ribonuclease H protein At1g65750 family [Senna tora]
MLGGRLVGPTTMRIRIGRNTKFWLDQWVPGFPCLATVSNFIIPQDEINKTVSDFTTDSGDWDWQGFAHNLPKECLVNIEGIQAPQRDAGEDSWFWNLTHNVEFTVKSAYSSYYVNYVSANNVNWKTIWRCDTVEKIRFFLWQLGHESIMTENQRKKRGFTNCDRCKRCGRNVEDASHAIRDCCWVMPIWKILVHEKNQVENYKEAEVINKLVNQHATTSENRCVTWQNPDEGWYKINTDGSMWNNSEGSSCGGVIRGSHGSWVTGFSKRLGRGDAFQAEVWGCLTGLRLAWDLKLPKVILELDSSMVFQFIQGNLDKNHKLYALAIEIKDLLSRDWLVNVNLINRKGNRLADAMAKYAKNLEVGLYRFDAPPGFCMTWYREDLVRVVG